MGAVTFTDDELGRADQFYRFSVKCDRAMNARLEAAARAAGVSVTTLVQRHFETILDQPADETGFSPDVFAREQGISAQAARVFGAMRKQADKAGVVSGGVRDFAVAAQVSAGHGGDYVAELMNAELVRMLVRPGGARPGTYRVSKVALWTTGSPASPAASRCRPSNAGRPMTRISPPAASRPIAWRGATDE